MPLYEYRCSACAHRFEVRQGFNDPPLASCPQCQGAAQRVIQPVGIVFKGSGWHSTDYRSSSYKKDAGSEKGRRSYRERYRNQRVREQRIRDERIRDERVRGQGVRKRLSTPAPAANSES